MSTFRDTLRKLFSRNIIIKKVPGDRIKTYDVSTLQSSGNKSMAYDRAYKWRTSRHSVSTWGSGRASTSNEEMEVQRNLVYIDYEEMDRDAIISAALDIYSDEATNKGPDNTLLKIKTPDDKIKKILYNLFYDVMNIEFNLWQWLRSACKYGDFMLYLDLREEYGVINVVPMHPSLIRREEGFSEDPNSVKFIYEGDGFFGQNKTTFENFEIAHFRMLGDTNFLPYGKSLIEPARKTYKALSLMEDAMLLHRIMRAPERRKIKIDVGNIAPEEVDAFVESVVNTMKKVPYIDEQTGDYNLRFNLQNMLEDFYLPVRGSESGTDIETLPGLTSEGQIDDVNYLKNKMLSALKIPKAYLGFEDSQAKATLAAEDVRFARTIERIQKIFVSELYKIAVIHLYIQGFDKEDLLNFELELNTPSVIYERQKIELLQSKIDLISDMQELNLFSLRYIYENILGLSEDEWKSEGTRIIEDLKERFRRNQILEEGNDPKLTGKSFGTPHDLASMQVASKMSTDEVKKLYEPDERENNPGRPNENTTFESDRDKSFGRDPLGRKAMDKSMEGLNKFLSKKNSIEQSLLNENDENNLKMLDENMILDEL